MSFTITYGIYPPYHGLILRFGSLWIKDFHKMVTSSSHMTISKRLRFSTDEGSSEIEHPFMNSFLKLCNPPICFGRWLMFEQSDMSRTLNLDNFSIASGTSSNWIQKWRRSTSKFSSLPISLGSSDSSQQLLILSFFRWTRSKNQTGRFFRSIQRSMLISDRFEKELDIWILELLKAWSMLHITKEIFWSFLSSREDKPSDGIETFSSLILFRLSREQRSGKLLISGTKP